MGSSLLKEGSGMCLSKTASVSAWILEVGVGNPSLGYGRQKKKIRPKNSEKRQLNLVNFLNLAIKQFWIIL